MSGLKKNLAFHSRLNANFSFRSFKRPTINILKYGGRFCNNRLRCDLADGHGSSSAFMEQPSPLGGGGGGHCRPARGEKGKGFRMRGSGGEGR